MTRKGAHSPAQHNPTIALIPVKSGENKSRLSQALSPEQRLRLTHWMLAHTLKAVARVAALDHVCLIGSGDDARAIQAAQRHGVAFVPEQAPTLNGALQPEFDHWVSVGHRVLILFADLPLLETSTVTGFVAAAEASPATLSLAPDTHQFGTNALFYRGRLPLKLVYGPESFSRFQQQTPNPHVFFDDALAQDLDTPGDWDRLKPLIQTLGFSLEVDAARPHR